MKNRIIAAVGMVFFIFVGVIICSRPSTVQNNRTLSDGAQPAGAITNDYENTAIPIIAPELLKLRSSHITELEYAAEREHNVQAARTLADYYSYVQYNVEKVIKYLKIAAENGDAIAQFNLGTVYDSDPRVRDLKLAKHWYTVAAASRDPIARAHANNALRELEPRPGN